MSNAKWQWPSMTGFTMDWLLRTLIQCAKELVAVFFILTAHQRLGAYDLFNTPFVLFLTLVVFAFPVMNTYMFIFLRFGPWFKYDTLLRSIAQTFMIAVAQIVGAFCAVALYKNKVKDNFDDSRFATFENDTQKLGILYHDSVNAGWWEYFFEEGMAVFVLLVGLVHLIEADIHVLLAHVFWLEPKASSPDSTPLLKRENEDMDTINSSKISEAGVTGGTVTSYNAIPIDLIVHVSILVAGIMRAFPSAHQSLHITLYVGNGILDEWPSDFIGRIIGGFFGTALALIYYHTIYYQANSSSKYNPLKKLVVECRKNNIFMESALTLPAHMKPGRD